MKNATGHGGSCITVVLSAFSGKSSDDVFEAICQHLNGAPRPTTRACGFNEAHWSKALSFLGIDAQRMEYEPEKCWDNKETVFEAVRSLQGAGSFIIVARQESEVEEQHALALSHGEVVDVNTGYDKISVETYLASPPLEAFRVTHIYRIDE